MLAGERAGNEQKIIMCRGTPAQFFFQCVNLVIFKLVIFKQLLLKSSASQICLGWIGMVIFSSLKSRPTVNFQNV